MNNVIIIGVLFWVSYLALNMFLLNTIENFKGQIMGTNFGLLNI